MAAPPPDPPETDAWEGERVARWIGRSEGLERQLEPVSDLLFASAGLRPGQRVLDVGCGTGPTTRRAAVAVGPEGHVTGLDVAGPMLEHAAGLARPAGSAPIDWVEADATTWQPGGAPFDVVLSRFGVMFFADPGAAFASLARAAAPGGRLCVAVWARRDLSPLFELPLQVALRAVGAGAGVEVPPVDGGPFSLGDETAVRALLRGAGWDEVELHAQRLPLLVAGGLGPAEAAATALDFGPTRVVAEGLDEAGRDRMVAAIAEAYADCLDADGHVVLDGTVVLVSARRTG